MKRWHFKKWFQHVVEFITAACMVIMLGIDSFNTSFAGSLIIALALSGTMLGGLFALKLFGRY